MHGSDKNSVGELIRGGDTGVVTLDHNGGAFGHEGAVYIHTTDVDFAKRACAALNEIGVPND